MKRLFAAIKIRPDEQLLKHYYRLRHGLKQENIKWVDPENLHLTLKFFGETPEEEIGNINEVIRPFAKSISPFKTDLEGVGMFGSRYKPRVIWIGIKDSNQLNELGTRLLLKLDEAGFLADRQNFVPHLTIGRIKELNDKSNFQKKISEMKDTFFQQLEVNEIILFESKLRPQGPTYLALETYVLDGNNHLNLHQPQQD